MLTLGFLRPVAGWGTWTRTTTDGSKGDHRPNGRVRTPTDNPVFIEKNASVTTATFGIIRTHKP